MQHEIIVYTLPVCPRCEELKEKLRSVGLEFAVRDIEDEDNMVDLFEMGNTLIEAPITVIDGHIHDFEDTLRAVTELMR